MTIKIKTSNTWACVDSEKTYFFSKYFEKVSAPDFSKFFFFEK